MLMRGVQLGLSKVPDHQVVPGTRLVKTFASAQAPTNTSTTWDTARSQFKWFSVPENPVFLENAGGSLVPLCVAQAIYDYMVNDYVQLEAGYEASTRADQTVQAAHQFMSTYMNADNVGHVAIGPSTSQLLANLATSMTPLISTTDQIIVHEACHEANAGPWTRLAANTGAHLTWWPVDPHTRTSSLHTLETLLKPNTAVVALTHVSNLLGEVLDVRAVVDMVRSKAPGARVVVDGVAYAPHRAIDVRAWDVDWYAFSSYKVWGPHCAVLYGKHAAHAELADKASGGLNHYWIPAHDYVYKFELGGVCHESMAGIVALQTYLHTLATAYTAASHDVVIRSNDDTGGHTGVPPNACRQAWCDRVTVETAYRAISDMEAPLTTALLTYLETRGEVVEVVGPSTWTTETRVPTVSFVHRHKESSEVAKALQAKGFAVRCGHNYAHRLMQVVMPKRDVEEGVVRVSALHYNTPQEIQGLVRAMDEVL